MRGSLTVLAGSLCLAATAVAQTRITGTVTDSAGAVVIGAKVSVRNSETGIVHITETNQSGVYAINI